jgi:hypothetical protein
VLRAAICSALLASVAAASAADRSRVERAAFQRENPCPSTGKPRGPCPGWQVDHRVSLCASGADTRGNMQWLRVEEHRRKTPKDVGECRAKLAGVQ